ncbi:TonB-dependent receptor domain-containing protein [Brevundimonas sp. PAMC22021]|uniref:TonB-dependent receptor domain-containing protein n=1 Tax=Brevundimonas sp. PAMC22021 TaxID=2861285 RepID=UPI001C62FC8C|nr:TonB-dependent receptor [Brevundimonas sp. PAMC22021]QYF87313.1 TonB-dependent receptor [Brevundimonas sp. PAMC22021]
MLKRHYLFGSTILAGALALAAPVLAQTAQPAVPVPPLPAQDEAQLDEIVVTGSLIRRDPTTTPTPLTVASREEILQSGENNVVDFLADIPALQSSQTPEDTTGGFIGIGGLSLLNLRNLGSNRTLVLVDGRRHVAGIAGGNAVDVDTIPSPLIERVEIITGGASATYGADAVAGVVNFIMRDDFEGIEFEAGVTQLTQGESALNESYSIIAGTNLFDDRLNIYGFAQYNTSDVLVDSQLDIDWINTETRLATADVDPAAAPNDGVFDVIAVGNLRSLNRPRGGILSLANGVRPSPTTDPDIPFGNCSATQQPNAFSPSICFATTPGKSYQFRPGGQAYLADFGFGQTTGAVNRTTTIGGSGDSLVEVETNRLPRQENKRFQVGANFDVLENVQAYAELKYVDERNVDVFQPHFIDLGIRAFGPRQNATLFGLTSGEIGLDNAYLDPTVRAAILANTRAVYNAAGVQTATVADARAQFRTFSYDLGFRPQTTDRELTRFVGGFRGDLDQLAFVKDISWDIGYTYGSLDSVNVETETIDVERYLYSVDAVRDTLNETGRGAGSIVCRVQLLAARGVTINSQDDGRVLAATDPTIAGCVPSNIFGEGGMTVARDYILTQLTTIDNNTQHDVRGVISGNLWDFWGAGPIGVAIGGEYRDERTSTDLTPFNGRVIFGNTGDDLPEVGYDVAEAFAELRIPLLSDVFLAEKLEIGGGYRTSQYSTTGHTETYSADLFWRPVQDIAFRSTYGVSVRAPTLGELFSPPFDTFPNLTDNCSSAVINGTADARIRQNRITNCALLGIPTTYVDPNPTSSNEGKSGSNPNLESEESESYSVGLVFTPRFAPGFSFVADYYDIEITNAIATLSAQTLLNLCTDEEQLNQTACDAFTRRPAGDPQEYEISDFVEGPFNFAALKVRGIDYQARFGFETSDLVGDDYGRIDLGLTGSWLIERTNFTSPTDPNFPTRIDTTANNPRFRFRTNTTWSKGPLSVTWRLDVQGSQTLTRIDQVLANFDTREDLDLLRTGNFYQNDFTFAYDLTDKATFRGGVLNAFDEEPNIQSGLADQFDLFGRRYFGSITLRY